MRRLSWTYRAPVGTVLACGLAVGLATPSTAASKLLSLKLDAPYVTVSFLDTEAHDKSNVLVLRPQGGGETLRVILSDEVPGTGKTVTKKLDAGIRPGVRYCAAVEVAVLSAEEPTGLPTEVPTGLPTELPTGVPTELPTTLPEPDDVGTIYETGTVCADPAGPAATAGGS
ncbi:hypothetical protein GCM10010302_02020 [Streptomyces polychromogenes]|uniref:Uncharacterized protein n=1 Tax=Streptomyces polychromogenes TaxID=67342 RepID=A0ABN0UZJ2_9ACTN